MIAIRKMIDSASLWLLAVCIFPLCLAIPALCTAAFSVEPLRQGLPVHQLHHQDTDAAVFEGAEDGRDVRVVDRREQPRLATEPAHGAGLKGQLRMEELERDVTFEIVVPRAEDLSHAPGAETAEDTVATHNIADRRKGVMRRFWSDSMLPTLRKAHHRDPQCFSN